LPKVLLSQSRPSRFISPHHLGTPALSLLFFLAAADELNASAHAAAVSFVLAPGRVHHVQLAAPTLFF
jgi:hypothetical protein